MADQAQAAAHWDAAYAQGDDTRSWFEKHPGMSLRMLDSAGVSAADAVIDVGGGASPLTGALVDRGFGDLTVLDISAAGMRYARDRLGSRADRVHWLTADVLSWHPGRRYQAWHDRAVFHFLTREEHRKQYLRTLGTATAPGAVAVFGCFAPDGPQHCSGLPVARYSPAQLARQLGAGGSWSARNGKSTSPRQAPFSRSPGLRCDDSPESWPAPSLRARSLASGRRFKGREAIACGALDAVAATGTLERRGSGTLGSVRRCCDVPGRLPARGHDPHGQEG